MVTWSYSSALCGVSTHMCTLGRNTKEFYFHRQCMSGPFAHNLTSVKPSGVREALSRLLWGGLPWGLRRVNICLWLLATSTSSFEHHLLTSRVTAFVTTWMQGLGPTRGPLQEALSAPNRRAGSPAPGTVFLVLHVI